MIRADRRALLGFAMAATALPLLATVPAAALSALRFAPPAAPMRYTRRLERGLPGGASLTVSRSFAVRFVRQDDGFRLDGEQLAVAVDAPPPIEALAQLERERVDTGMFPLLLDHDGAIRSVGRSSASAQLDAAVREVEARIEHWRHTTAERTELRAFVDAVHRSAGQLATDLPRDLFAPVDCPREESRALPLPDGTQGQVRTAFAAERDPATGLMREARREIVTEVSGDVRRTVESWSLALL